MATPDELEDPTELSSPSLAKKPAPTTYIGRVIAGRYRITGPIGRGGAGNVYRGLQEPLGREVAVKILRPDLPEASRVEWQARFLREAALAGRLSHPNVVTVHDYGVAEDGASYVVMELLKGTPLSDLTARGKRLDPVRAADIVCQVAKGLRAVHEAELIHRDVKPHNIVILEEDGRERAVLLDFGLVKTQDMDDDTDSYKTRAGTYMGTPAYMAPEQARGGTIDHRADLYALGILLYRLLTGTVPFSADHPLGMAVQHMTEPVPFFSETARDADLPPRLEKITRRLLEKDPKRRYRNAADLVAELERFLEKPPPPRVPAPPVTAAVGAGVGAIGASLGLVGVAMAAVAVFVALLMVLLFAQSSGRPSAPIQPVTVRPVPLPTLPGPRPVEEPAPAPEITPPVPSASPTVPTRPVPKPRTRPSPTPPPRPSPRPRPAPQPAPSPTPSSAPAPIPMPGIGTPPPPVPAPSSAPSSAPDPSQVGLVVDEVAFSEAQAAAALQLVNSATSEQLQAAGVYERGAEILVAKRPFDSLEAVSATYGIGTKTMLRLRDAAH